MVVRSFSIIVESWSTYTLFRFSPLVLPGVATAAPLSLKFSRNIKNSRRTLSSAPPGAAIAGTSNCERNSRQKQTNWITQNTLNL